MNKFKIVCARESLCWIYACSNVLTVDNDNGVYNVEVEFQGDERDFRWTLEKHIDSYEKVS